MIKSISIVTIIVFCLTIAAKADKPQTVYDSTKNFLGEKAILYKGQKLYLKPFDDDRKQMGYDGFLIDYKIKGGTTENSNVYKFNEHTLNSKYDLLAEKYYQVIEVIKLDSTNPNEISANNYAFKLINLYNNDTLYYIYQSEYEHIFPFVVDGYYQKQKKLVIGKKFVFKDELIATAVDAVKGIMVVPMVGDEWTCTEVIQDDPYSLLSIAFENTKKQKIILPIEPTIGSQKLWKTYTKAEADKYIKQFGQEKFYSILKGQTKAGMTKQMCVMALGEPDQKKTYTKGTIKCESFMYGKFRTLVFENGILK